MKLKTPVANTKKMSQKKERMYLFLNIYLGKMKAINTYAKKIWGTIYWNCLTATYGILRKQFNSGLGGEMAAFTRVLKSKKQNQNSR